VVQKLNQKQVHRCVIHSPELPHDIQVKTVLFAKPLLMPDVQRFADVKNSKFMSRICCIVLFSTSEYAVLNALQMAAKDSDVK
jgi:hypothetical protein